MTDQAYTVIDGRAGIYTGEWQDDKPNGQGRMEYENGEVYEGQWKDGQRDGEGTYTDADGNVTVEVWKNGEKVQ